MLSLTTLLYLALAASSSFAATITVNVGSGGALKYDPETVTAAIGDVVNFNFLGGAHTASQSTFAAPCVNAGFNSGPKPASGTNTTFSIMVNSTTPIWVYCATGQHCQAGMVMAINPPTTGNTFSAFQAAAMGNAAPAGATAGASASISGSASASGASAAASPSPTGGASTLGGSMVLSGLGAVVAGVAVLL